MFVAAGLNRKIQLNFTNLKAVSVAGVQNLNYVCVCLGDDFCG
jgi:hypothetical protein